MLVARRVKKTTEKQDDDSGLEELPLSDFRHTPAWVLLGEPGAGKSEALRQEARDVGGEYVTVSEFVETTPPLQEWYGKTLFIDALDEARAAGSVSLILHIRQQLRQLGKPTFRLSCRAADWHGSTDKTELQSISPDSQLAVLQLCPLSDDDIQQILQNQYNVAEPKIFIEQAEQHGIAQLLSNPQMLGLMARAVSGGSWPESRSEVYRLACEKLAQESNALHRQISKAKAVDGETLLNAAGQLFAIQLLSSKAGIATDLNASNTGNPELDQFKPESSAAARKALQSALFTQAPGQAERLAPCHRSIAEYLAAKWLANKLDREGLPQGRLLNLLLGFDGGVVADLRGLLAWLAHHSTSIRSRLIKVDPLGVVLYGDVRPFSPENKRHLLHALRQQAERFPGFRWSLWQDMTGFRALADDALLEDFQRILQSPGRDEASQSHMDCVLDILEYSHTYDCMVAPLLAVIKDASLWPRLRYSALRVWLKTAAPSEIKTLLAQICADQVKDDDDELMGKLLDLLYPNYLTPDELISCLHAPKDSHLIGSYLMFWEEWLPERAPAHHLPDLLDGLNTKYEIYDEDRTEWMLSRSVDRLLIRALNEFGESATGEQLFIWLGVGANQHGYFNRNHNSRSQIQRWLEQRPDKYKAVLAQCVQAIASGSRHAPYLLLHDAAPPADIGLWHLHLAGIPEEAIARIHVQYATHALMQQRGAEGLSLEALEAWAREFPERADWLNEELICDLTRENWRLKDAARTRPYRERQDEKRRQRTQEITPELPAIAAGTAPAYLLEQLVMVWLKRFSDIHGETVSARFASYSDLGDVLMQAADSGFRKCLQRPDLLSVTDIIDLNQAGKRYYISLPCLLGLQLNWADTPEQVATLPDDRVELLLAIYLCTPHFGLDGLNSWCTQTAQQKPELFSRVLVHQATNAFAAGNTSAGMTHLLARDTAYARVAQLASPELLRLFPENASAQQLHDLRQLLRAALVTAPEYLPALALNKLKSPQLNTEQRLLWLAVDLLSGSSKNEDEFWQRLGRADDVDIAMQLAVEVVMQGIQMQAAQPSKPEQILGRLIEILIPHAEMEYRKGGGLVTVARDLGEELRGMIDWLGAQPTVEASNELQRLLACPALATQLYRIQNTLEQQQAHRRETEFKFLDLKAVADVLANQAPANVADLTYLALSYLDDIAHELRNANDDGYRMFWNITKAQPAGRREENLCRDVLLNRLRSRLTAHGISIAPEYDHAGDKRADLHLDYRNQLTLPIEIKRDDHAKLWSALRNQLITQYVDAPKSEGHGIYLVLWFGESKNLKSLPNRQPKPTTPAELKTKLEAQLTSEEQQRVFVRVLDVSWPT
ncbi:NACHT domain-containing protein [Pseudomonas sp.]|uniref:NACHT domain-containing protein n=1 Tax=Pseudomonas sp. TaxID=306 RepID=UPI003982105F